MRARRTVGWQSFVVGAAFLAPWADLTPQAAADSPASNPSLTSAWIFDVGAVFQNLDGGANVITRGGGGAGLSFSQMGLEEQSISPLLAVRWRFADRWRFDALYDSIDVKGRRGNSSTLEFGRITIPAGYQIDSAVKTRNYSAFVGYSLFKGSSFELGARLGATVMDANVSLSGYFWAGGTQTTVGPERARVLGPIPTIGLYASYALSNQWSVEGSIDGLAGSLGDYSGHYLAAGATLNYWYTDRFAMGIGFRYVDGKLEHDGSLLTESVDLQSCGLVAKAAVGF
jgi:hypothetical protein